MGIKHGKPMKTTIDPTRCLTPTPGLGPIEEVNETDLADENMIKHASEVTAMRLTFSSSNQNSKAPEKRPRRHSVALASKAIKIPLQRAPTMLPTTADGASPSTASSKYSHSNPSMQLTSSSSGMASSTHSAEDATTRKPRRYGQLATQVKCRQVIVAPLRVLSPKAVSWNTSSGGGSRRIAFEEEPMGRKASIELRSPRAIMKDGAVPTVKMKNKVPLSKPPLYVVPKSKIEEETIRRQKTVATIQTAGATAAGMHNAAAGPREKCQQQQHGLDLVRQTEIDIVPLTARIQSWSKGGSGGTLKKWRRGKEVEPPM